MSTQSPYNYTLCAAPFQFILEGGRITAIDAAGSFEDVAGGSWAAVTVDPLIVIAGDEAGATALHAAVGGAPSFVLRDGGGEADEGSESNED
jgi:hypothetical protein